MNQTRYQCFLQWRWQLSALLLTVVWPLAFAQTVTNDYQTIVGPNNFATSFKLFNDPHRTVDEPLNNLYRMQDGSFPNTLVVRLRVDGTTNTKLKFFFPPGTVRFSGSFLLANRSDIPALGIMRMLAPPVTSLSQVTLDKAFTVDNAGGDGNEFGVKILTNLYTPNKEVYFYGLAGGGGLPISFGAPPIEPIPRTGGYVYGHFQYPSGRLATGNLALVVDKDCYTNWYNNAKWDAAGNPLETVSHSCASSAPNIPPTLSISNSSLVPGVSAVLSIKNAADIGTCTVSPPSLLTIGPKSADKLSVSVSVPQAAVVNADTQGTINCTGAASPQLITVKKTAVVPPVVVSPINLSDVSFKNSATPDNFNELRIAYKNNVFGHPGNFSCQLDHQYVDYISSTAKKIVLKSPLKLTSSLVLSELTCSAGTSNWKADFYLSKASDGIVRLHPVEPSMVLAKEVVGGFVRLKGIAPTTVDTTGALAVWFGAELKGGESYALAWNDASKKNEWKPGVPDMQPLGKVAYVLVPGTNNEFSFDLAGITQAAIDAYKKGDAAIKGTVFYQFGSGAVRQLNTAWVP